MGYPEDCKKTSDRQQSGRGQSQRTPRRIARQFAPAGWTMCECEADKEWLLCERTEAVAAELAEQFQKHLMQESHEVHGNEELPYMHSSVKEITMSKYQLQLEEEERACNQLHDNKENICDHEENNKRPSATAKEKSASKHFRSNISEKQLNGDLDEQAMGEVSAPDEETDCVQNKASIKRVPSNTRNSSRRRRSEVRSGSENAESGRDGAAVKNHQDDPFDTPSRKLSRAERRAANAMELASQDPQEVQQQGKLDGCDVQIDSQKTKQESPVCTKNRAKDRKSKRTMQSE